MIIRKTKPSEAQRVNELFAIAFEQPLEGGPADNENERICHFAAFEDDDKTMMSTLSVTDYTVNLDGSDCKMGGMGGAATLPQFRRRGGIRGCFEKALPWMYASGHDLSYLYPFSTAYYRKFGYEVCGQKLEWAVDLTLWHQPAPEGTWVLAEPGNLMLEDIRKLDRVWERTYNLMVRHGQEDYGWVEELDPAETREYTYVCFDGNQTPKAYTTFRTVMEADGRNLVCSRFCFDGKPGFLLLMGLFQSMATDHLYAKFKTPLEKSLQYYVPEWSLGAVKWKVLANDGMVRVINVPRVLEKAGYRGSGEAVLKITDVQIPENDGTWRVVFRDGKALSVEKTELPPDAHLTVQAFSTLICGCLEWEDAREVLDGIRVANNGCLDRIFYRKKLMITDYF